MSVKGGKNNVERLAKMEQVHKRLLSKLDTLLSENKEYEEKYTNYGLDFLKGVIWSMTGEMMNTEEIVFSLKLTSQASPFKLKDVFIGSTSFETRDMFNSYWINTGWLTEDLRASELALELELVEEVTEYLDGTDIEQTEIYFTKMGGLVSVYLLDKMKLDTINAEDGEEIKVVTLNDIFRGGLND